MSAIEIIGLEKTYMVGFWHKRPKHALQPLHLAFAVPLLACSLSALVRGRTRAAVLWALPLVLVKEDQGFTVAALGFVMMAAGALRVADGEYPGRWPDGPAPPAGRPGSSPADRLFRGGLLLIVWGLAWSAVAIIVIIPHFNAAHVYSYWAAGGVIGPSGHHAAAAAVLGQFRAHAAPKLWTLLLLLLPVAGLALGSPLAVVAGPSLLLRFVSTNSYYWGDGYHYNATLMPIVFIAAIDALARLRAGGSPLASRAGGAGAGAGLAAPARPRLDRAVTRSLPLLMLALAAALVPAYPLAGLWRAQTYQAGAQVQAENAAMAQVPRGTTVEATLGMLAPLAARDDAFWIGNAGNPAPRYVVFDGSDSGWDPGPADPLSLVEQRHPGVTYRQVFLEDDVYVFRATGPNGSARQGPTAVDHVPASR